MTIRLLETLVAGHLELGTYPHVADWKVEGYGRRLELKSHTRILQSLSNEGTQFKRLPQ